MFGGAAAFGAFIKQTLKIKNQLQSLENRFKSTFGNVNTKGLRTLTSQFALSNIEAKKLLSTVGQFAQGMGQSKAYVQQFSSSLSKAAADYAAYMGINDVSEVGKKFAKATLGEVGELKDIGIIVDVTSESFKNLTKNIQETTGVSEAQARQMAIQKSIIEQVQYAAGNAQSQMTDGWRQLTILLDNFKQVLGGVGKIFSSVFGPFLHILNQILAIPFIKSITAWFVALGSVVFGYNKILKVLNLVSKTQKEVAKTTLDLSKNQAMINAQNMYLDLKKEELKLNKKILEINTRQAELKKKLTDKGLKASDRTTKEGKEKNSLSSQKTGLKKELKFIQQAMASAIAGFGNFDKSQLGGFLNSSMIDPLLKTDLLDTFTDLGNTAGGAADKVDDAASSVGKFGKIMNIITALNEKLNAILAFGMKGITKFGNAIKSLSVAIYDGVAHMVKAVLKSIGLRKAAQTASSVGSVASGAVSGAAQGALGGAAGYSLLKFLRGLGRGLGNLGRVLAKAALVIAAFIIVVDSLIIVFNLFTGRAWNADTITKRLVTSIYNYANGVKDAATAMREAQQSIKTLSDQYDQLARLQKNLKNVSFDRLIKGLTAIKALSRLQTKENESASNLQNLEQILNNAKKRWNASQNISTSDADRTRAYEEYKKALQDYTSALRDHYDILDKIKQKQREVYQINKKYSQQLDAVAYRFNSLIGTFNYGFQNGKFGNWTEKGQSDALTQRVNDLSAAANNLMSGQWYLSELKQEQLKQIYEQLFENQKQLLSLRLNALMKQRDAIINNLKQTNAFVREYTKYRVTAQGAVDANSVQAVRLQSRVQDRLSQNQYAPIIEQQKQVRDIQKQILQEQKNGYVELKNISRDLIKIISRLGSFEGATTTPITPVDPF